MMSHSDNSDEHSNISNCSCRTISTNRTLSLKTKSSDTSCNQSDSHFDDLKPDDETDNASYLNRSESIEKFKTKNTRSKPCSRKCSSYRGYFFSSLSGAFYLFTSVIVTYVRNISAVEHTMFMFVGIFVFTLPFVIHSQENPFGPRYARHIIFCNSLFLTTGIVFRFIAFKYLPVGDATVIALSSPALITVLARIFLKEPCGYFQCFTLFLTLAGLILISKLSSIGVETNNNYTTTEYIYGVGGAMSSMILSSFTYIFLKKIKNVNSSVFLWNFALLAIIETLFVTLFTEEFKMPTCGFEQWLVVLLGIFGFLAQMLLTIAIKEENAGTVSIIRVGTDIVLAFIWQIWFFSEIPDNYSISGAILICLAVLLINVQKYFST